jgi:hypothetical protein
VRGLLALLRKEARDVRALTWVYVALVPLAPLAVRWYLEARYDAFALEPETTRRYLEVTFPAIVLLYAAIVASDLVAGDVASRRMHQLALLPVRPLTVWTAKVAVLLGGTALVGAWTFVAQAWTLAAIDGVEHAAPFFRDMETIAVGVVPAAGLIGCVLLVSTMGIRGLGAVMAGAMLAAALGAAYWWGRITPRWIAGDDFLWAAIAAGALFVASAAAFVRGRVHLGLRLRPAVIGGAALAVLLGVPAVGLAAAARHVVPGSSLCMMIDRAASPAGPYVALTYVNRLDERAGCSTFVLSLDDGTLREIEPRGRLGGWQEDGTLIVQREMDDGTLTGGFVDPATGRPVRLRVLSPDEQREEAFRRNEASRARKWWSLDRTGEPNLWRLRRDKDHVRTVRSVVRPAAYGQVTGDLSLFAIAPDADHLVRLDAETGEETPLFTSEGFFDGASVVWPDEKGIVVAREGRWSWIDLRAKSVHAFPAEVRAVSLSLAPKGPGRLRSCGVADSYWAVVDPVSGRIVRVDRGPWGGVCPLHDGGLALIRGDATFLRYDASLQPVPAPSRTGEVIR